MTLQSDIESLWDHHTADDVEVDQDTITDTLDSFLDDLESGSIRAATTQRGEWTTNEWVKQGVLLNFVYRESRGHEYGDVTYYDVLPLQDTAAIGQRGTRNTPNGTVVRRGAYIGSNAILMSPSFVNAGAYIDDGTLVDSCDTVGSCAQIGSNVKLGANTLVGGVLEPVESTPVIIEDNVSLGAGCRVTSGFTVKEKSIVGENTLLTPRVPVYDLVDETIIYGHLPSERRAFTRYVESSVGEHELFSKGAFKPAVVATDIEADTRAATKREEALRE